MNENNNVNTNIDNNNVPTATIPVANSGDKFVMQQPQIVDSNTVQMPQVNPIPPVQPQQVLTSNISPNNDPNTMTNENLKKVEIKNYTPPSKFKMFLLVLFFIVLIAFVLFLPEVTSLIKKYTQGEEKYQKEEITTGKLVCVLNTNTKDLDKEYEATFSFADSELYKTKFITTTRGDSTADTEVLDELAENCKKINTETQEIEGFTIKCDYMEGRMVETQVFELETVDEDKITAAFTEAGGVLPGYRYKQSIDDIESNMKVSGYTCNREK